jgi:hypothetical protein
MTELMVRTGVLVSKGLRTVLAMIYPGFFMLLKIEVRFELLVIGVSLLTSTFKGALTGAAVATLFTGISLDTSI